MTRAGDRAEPAALRQAEGMTTPESETPQPRDIALEQESPEVAASLEAQSAPREAPQGDEADVEGHPS